MKYIVYDSVILNAHFFTRRNLCELESSVRIRQIPNLNSKFRTDWIISKSLCMMCFQPVRLCKGLIPAGLKENNTKVIALSVNFHPWNSMLKWMQIHYIKYVMKYTCPWCSRQRRKSWIFSFIFAEPNRWSCFSI